MLKEEGLDRLVCAKLGLETPEAELGEWEELTRRIDERRELVEIALVGKYVKLQDAYLSVREALKHAGLYSGCAVRVRWVDAENMSYDEAAELLEAVDGVLVPGGFGSRGWEGKILACRVARERRIPYLGICLGMHVAVSEFARHVVGLDGANSTEMDPETPHPVIDLLPEQKGIEDLGGTMRLGAQAVEVADGTRARELYGDAVIFERHRHRYEVNNLYREQLVDAGLVVSGTFEQGRLVEIIELPGSPVVRRQPVSPGVQVAADPAGAALPRLRRGGARARPLPCGRGRCSGLKRHGRDRLLFLELAALPSPPGEERAVADVVLRYLRGLGLQPDEDDAGPRIGSTTGNVYARLEATAPGTPLFFCAHLDTVPPNGPIEPVVEDGVVRNAGGTILGADNKSAVVAMLEAVRRVLAENRPHAGIELVFTPKEEVGLIGAAAFEHERLHAQLGYVYDQAAPIGEIILGAPWAQALEVTFHGRASHAGMFPDEGRSAIQAAAKAIADLRLGRVGEETTANVGVISGGTAMNIVPEWCTFQAEARCSRRAEAERARAGDARRVLVRRDGGRVRGGDGAAQELQRLSLQAGRGGRASGRTRARRAAAVSRATLSPAVPQMRTSSTTAAAAV